MGNKNYSNFSKHFKNNNDKHVVSEELKETVLNAGGEVMTVEPVETNNEVMEGQISIDEVLTIEEVVELKDEEVAEVNADGNLTGVVSGCARLNLRKEASKDSDVLLVLDKDTELVVDPTEETEEFYKVCTSSGVEGYCMKKFITIK